jgi:phenylalanyl-tRNA synthetase alpha chain
MGNEGPALRERLEEIRRRGVMALESAEDREALERARVEYLGRSGLLSEAMSELRALPAEEKPAAGQAGNRAKKELEGIFEARLAAIDAAESGDAADLVDLTPRHR